MSKETRNQVKETLSLSPVNKSKINYSSVMGKVRCDFNF